MNEIDEDLWLDSDVSINAVFIISQRSVKAPVNKAADNGDIQFANYVLRHYQEQLLRESEQEGYKLHMAFVYNQNGTEALDFPDVEHYLSDESNPNYLNIEQNKLFCVDHCIENSDAQTSVATLWFLAMNLLSRQENRCSENNEQTENRVYFISNRDATSKDRRAAAQTDMLLLMPESLWSVGTKIQTIRKETILVKYWNVFQTHGKRMSAIKRRSPGGMRGPGS